MTQQTFPMKAIASSNGLEATRLAFEWMQAGADTLDAIIAGIALIEDDPNEVTVGYGGLPNEQGIVELDAGVMHGPTHRAGAVAGLRGVRHPTQVAKLVMEQTDHVLLVGQGALEFAQANGFRVENLLTEKARKIWLHWKRTLSPKDDWLPPPADRVDPEDAECLKLSYGAEVIGSGAAAYTPSAKPKPPPRPSGTVHCSAINAAGEISCATSTSGLAFKIAGRVGDSPIVGAGLYVDQDCGSCGSVGRGEANLQGVSSFVAVELMRHGRTPRDAGLEVLQRIARHTTAGHLLQADGRPNFNLRLFLLGRDGTHAGVSLWGPAEFAITDAAGTRLEPCVSLWERE